LKSILFLLSYSFVDAQDSRETVLVDEIGALQCEFLWASLDAFAAKLKDTPNSVATVEISGETDHPLSNFYWESFIRSHLTRAIPSTQFRIIRTALADEQRVKLWLTPAGSALPKIEPVEWSFAYPPNTKPFIFTNCDNYSVKTGVCVSVDEIALLRAALDANPLAKVHVVLIVRSKGEFQRRKRATLRMLTNDYSIVSSRIKIFPKITSKPNPYGIKPVAEFWFVPAKNE
jgi:hypothetical protein